VLRSRNESLTSHQKQELAAPVDTDFQCDFMLKANANQRKQLLIY